MNKLLKQSLSPALIAGIALLIIWQAIVTLFSMPRFILPSPVQVALSFYDNFSMIFDNALITGVEILLGFMLGVILGGATALILARYERLKQLSMPLLLLSQAIPIFAIAPILTLWLGYGMASKVVMSIIVIYFPLTSSFLDGLLNTPKQIMDLATILCQNTSGQTPIRSHHWRIFYHIRVPLALPQLASGLRLTAVYAPIGAVIGEWVGASKGLGYLMLMANARTNTDLMFAALTMLVIMTISLHKGVGLVANKLENYASGESRN